MENKIKLLKKLGLDNLGKIASESLNKTKQSLNKTFQNLKKKRKEEIVKKIRKEKIERKKQLLKLIMIIELLWHLQLWEQN